MFYNINKLLYFIFSVIQYHLKFKYFFSFMPIFLSKKNEIINVYFNDFLCKNSIHVYVEIGLFQFSLMMLKAFIK